MTERPRYYDRQGNPMSLEDWGRRFENVPNKIVRQEHTPNGRYWISTVWLGLDHSWGDGPPLIFETMVFPQSVDKQYDALEDLVEGEPEYGRWSELACERYSTEEEAIAGHEAMVRKWSAVDKQADSA